MNKFLETYARNFLKTNLVQKCDSREQIVFKRMYAKPGKDDKLSIEEVIDKMPIEKLDWAMMQVDNTLRKRGIYVGS